MTIPSYLQRFREKFGTRELPEDDFTADVIKDYVLHLEQFLTQEHQQLIQDAVELGEGLKRDCGHDSHSHCMEENCHVYEDDGFNAAIVAYQELIRNNLK